MLLVSCYGVKGPLTPVSKLKLTCSLSQAQVPGSCRQLQRASRGYLVSSQDDDEGASTVHACIKTELHYRRQA